MDQYNIDGMSVEGRIQTCGAKEVLNQDLG